MKELFWFRSTLKELRSYPTDVKREIGFALYHAQCGKKNENITPLKKFSDVFEIKSDYDTNTFRAIYTIEIKNAIYVIHVFQKKSKRGSKTPKEDLEKIKTRIKDLRNQISNQSIRS